MANTRRWSMPEGIHSRLLSSDEISPYEDDNLKPHADNNVDQQIYSVQNVPYELPEMSNDCYSTGDNNTNNGVISPEKDQIAATIKAAAEEVIRPHYPSICTMLLFNFFSSF